MGILLLFGRLFVQRDLLNISEQLGVTEASIHVIPVLTAFTEDLEPVVRSTMMEKIPGLARFFLDVRLRSFLPRLFLFVMIIFFVSHPLRRMDRKGEKL